MPADRPVTVQYNWRISGLSDASGRQAIPTIISMLFFWPVLITQIWGIVQQSKLDDKALEIAEEVLKNRDSFTTLNLDINGMVFCTNCGYRNIKGAKFCSECGQAL